MQTVSIPMEQLAQILELQLENGTAPLTVTGTSMHPMLRSHKDIVYLKAVDMPPKKGALILYRRNDGQYVLHRIVSVLPDGSYICSGDNQYVSESVSASQVVAVTTCFRRGRKLYTEHHLGYRVYVWAWVFLFPVRRPILGLRRFFARIYRKVYKGS